MAIPQISKLSQAPNRNRPQTFSQDGDTFFGEIQTKLEPELNATVAAINSTVAEIDQNAIVATIAAQNTNAAAQTVSQTTNVSAWVSGTSYPINTCAISQVNFQTYRKRTSSAAGTIDPANDPVNWTLLVGNGAFIPKTNTSSTFDLSTSNYYKRTMNGNETWSFINCPMDGYSWTVELEHVSGTLSLPAAVKTPSNQVYTFTPGKTHLLMFVTSNKGVRIRLVAAPNYDN